jgi:hypothetical protein
LKRFVTAHTDLFNTKTIQNGKKDGIVTNLVLLTPFSNGATPY